MADYTTVNRVRNALGGRPTSSISNDVIDEAITDATALIKGKLGKDITTKINAAQVTNGGTANDTPSEIRMIATFIAAHFAMTFTFGGNASLDDSFTENYKQAIEWLDDMRSGDMDIGDIETNLLPTSNTKSYEPVFQVDDPINHELDDDRAQDIEDNRTG